MKLTKIRQIFHETRSTTTKMSGFLLKLGIGRAYVIQINTITLNTPLPSIDPHIQASTHPPIHAIKQLARREKNLKSSRQGKRDHLKECLPQEVVPGNPPFGINVISIPRLLETQIGKYIYQLTSPNQP